MKISPITVSQSISCTGSIKRKQTDFFKQPAIEDKYTASSEDNKIKEINEKAQKLVTKAYKVQGNINSDKETMEYELYDAAYNIEEGKDGGYEDYGNNARRISFHLEGSNMIMIDRTQGTTKTTTFEPAAYKILSIKISQNNYPNEYFLIKCDHSKGTKSIYNNVRDLPNGNKEYFSCTTTDTEDYCNTYTINGEEYPDGKLKHAENTFVFENNKLTGHIEQTNELKTEDGPYAEQSEEVFGFNKGKPVLYGTEVITLANGKTLYGSKYIKTAGLFSKFKKVV